MEATHSDYRDLGKVESFHESMIESMRTDTQLSRRRGRFAIPRCMLENSPAEVINVLGYMVVVRAEMLLEHDAVLYSAWSPLFDVIKPGDVIPHYNIEVESGMVRARRVDDV